MDRNTEIRAKRLVSLRLRSEKPSKHADEDDYWSASSFDSAATFLLLALFELFATLFAEYRFFYVSGSAVRTIDTSGYSHHSSRPFVFEDVC